MGENDDSNNENTVRQTTEPVLCSYWEIVKLQVRARIRLAVRRSGPAVHKQSSQPLSGLQFPLLLNEEVSLGRCFIIMLPGALGFLQRAGDRNEK